MKLTWVLPFVAAACALFTSGRATSDEYPNWKRVTYISAWGPCPQGGSCGSVWLVDRATQSIERKGGKDIAPHKLSGQEWMQLEEMVRLAKLQASTCLAAPTDVFETLEIEDSDNIKHSLDVTGCVFDQGANSVKTLAAWFQKH